MSTARTIGVVLIAILLFFTVGAANSVVATERTALNGEYVSSTLESEGVYEEMANNTQNAIASEVSNISVQDNTSIPQGVEIDRIDTEQVTEDAVPEDYVQSQAKTNIQRIFAYLHGETDELTFQVDTDRLKQNVRDAVSNQVVNVDPSGVLDESATTLPGTNYRIDGFLAQEMAQSETRYNEIQSDFHAQYSAQERETIASEGKTEARQEAEQATGEYADGITNGTITIQEAMIDGLATDMSYDEYMDRYNDGKRQFADAAGQVAVAQIDQQLDDELSSGNVADSDSADALEGARSQVQTIDMLQIALPILALLLIALLYGITRSWQTTAKTTGVVFVVAALVSLLVVLIQSIFVVVIEDQIENALADAEVVGMDVATSFVEGIFDTLAAQSLALGAIGLVLVGLVMADRRGYLETLKAQYSGTAAGAGGAGAGGAGAGGAGGGGTDGGGAGGGGTGQVESEQHQGSQSGQESQHGQPDTQSQQSRQPRQPTGQSIAQSGPLPERTTDAPPEGQESEPSSDETGESESSTDQTEESGSGTADEDQSGTNESSQIDPDTEDV